MPINPHATDLATIAHSACEVRLAKIELESVIIAIRALHEDARASLASLVAQYGRVTAIEESPLTNGQVRDECSRSVRFADEARYSLSQLTGLLEQAAIAVSEIERRLKQQPDARFADIPPLQSFAVQNEIAKASRVRKLHPNDVSQEM